MSENTPVPPGAPASDAAAKKQTVRISLPPKPTAGPSIKVPAAGAPAAPAAAPSAPAAPAAGAGGASVTQRVAVPPPPAKPTMGGHAPAAPAAAPAAPAAAAKAPAAPPPPPRPSAPVARGGAAVSGIDIGLGVATVLVAVAAIVRLVMLIPSA